MIIYLTILVILLFCIIVYDLGGTKQYREAHIRILLLIMICVSGFSYRLGGDGIGYMKEYGEYGTLKDLSFSYLTKFDGRQPAWVLLVTLCKTITIDFWLFKMIQAIVLNVAYFKAIRYSTKYVFSAILVYYVLIYFNQNFQLLRESFAISCFLLALPSFSQNKWKKYYLLSILAFLFHEGAFFLFVLPFIKILGINKYSVLFYLIGTTVIIIKASDILEYLMILSTSGDISNDKFYFYFQNKESAYNFSSITNVVLSIMIPVIILWYYKKKNITLTYFYPAVVSLCIYSFSLVLPIVYRFGNYVLLFNYILITDFIIKWVGNQKAQIAFKLSCISFLLFVFVGFKARFYFTENYGETRYKEYVQYYPYASVFEKYEDPDREALARSLGF